MRRFAVVGVAVSIGVLAFAPSGVAASGSRRRSPDRASGPRVRSWSGRRRARADDPHGRRGVPAQARDPRDGQRSVARRGERWAAAEGRCSVSASSGSERWGGTSRCSSSGYGATASDARAVDGRFTRKTSVALRRYQLRRGLDPPTGSPVPGRTARLRGHAAAPVAWHVVEPGRASSRSPRATT